VVFLVRLICYIQYLIFAGKKAEGRIEKEAGVRFSGGDQSKPGRRDPIQPLRNPINPTGLYLRNFLFVRKIHRLFLFPSNPAPHRTANSPRAERRRHATQRNRPPPRGNAPIRPKPSLVVAALCVHLPQIFFLASHPGLGLLGISGRRRPSSCGASSARP
jgi:hypothetical protein